MNKKKTCPVCNKEFVNERGVGPSIWNKRKYCSHKCSSTLTCKGRKPWNKGVKTGLVPKTAIKKGQHIGKEFKKGQTPWNKGKSNLSAVGEKSHLWKGGKPSCVDCRKTISYGKKRCRTCSGKLRGGINSKFWKGGITPLNQKIRGSVEYRLWRESVFKRDKYTCVWCGEVGGKLNADHIKPFAYYPELRFAIDNGRTLCVECHKTTESYLNRWYKNARRITEE